MAVSLAPAAPAAPPAPHPTLLATLKAYSQLLQTRRSLLAELDQALATFLASPGGSSGSSDAPTPPSHDPFVAPQPQPAQSTSTCALESLHPPPPRSEEELEAVLRIAFGGLVEVKEEARCLAAEVGERWGRGELEGVVGRVERWESERVKATLELYQLRRLVHLDSSLSSSVADSVREKEQLRTELAQKIQEEVQEITAEIADLSAAAEEDEPATSGET
ncbi:hypothetical protein JCM6882_006752 [Rhodosporidiobolus microsporus]